MSDSRGRNRILESIENMLVDGGTGGEPTQSNHLFGTGGEPYHSRISRVRTFSREKSNDLFMILAGSALIVLLILIIQEVRALLRKARARNKLPSQPEPKKVQSPAKKAPSQSPPNTQNSTDESYKDGFVPSAGDSKCPKKTSRDKGRNVR